MVRTDPFLPSSTKRLPCVARAGAALPAYKNGVRDRSIVVVFSWSHRTIVDIYESTPSIYESHTGQYALLPGLSLPIPAAVPIRFACTQAPIHRILHAFEIHLACSRSLPAVADHRVVAGLAQGPLRVRRHFFLLRFHSDQSSNGHTVAMLLRQCPQSIVTCSSQEP